MDRISKSGLRRHVAHRPYPLPKRPWVYYQEWHNVVFVHWKVPIEQAAQLVPPELELDLLNGEAWISLVIFYGKRFRPRFLPPIPPVSNFYEVNVRTYVVHKNKPGIYFLSVEAGKRMSAFLSRIITKIPYEYAAMSSGHLAFKSVNKQKSNYLELKFQPSFRIVYKSETDKWLTERYCVYNVKRGKVYCHEVHHQEWTLNNAVVRSIKMCYTLNGVELEFRNADLAHHSHGQQVLAWSRKRVR